MSLKREYDLIDLAISKGAKLVANFSGGKDGQAMIYHLIKKGYSIESILHMDLGRAEWKESLIMCKKIKNETGIPLNVRRRKDGLDLVDYMKRRLIKLKGTGNPFWPSSEARYCTSDLKRSVANVFYTEMGDSLIISCEGIRADESPRRAKKKPLTIRSGSSTFYKKMTVKQALENFNPKYKLKLNFYPIFKHTIKDVFAEGGNTVEQLNQFRLEYKKTKVVNPKWNFSPVYVYGNNRVSCVICILSDENDISNGVEHYPELLNEYIEMQDEGNCTFRVNLDLKKFLI